MISKKWEGLLLDNMLSKHCPANPDWYDCDILSGLSSATDMIRLPDFSDDLLDSTICDYLNFVHLRKGDDALLEVLTEWFTTEDILFFNIAYDDDGDFKLSYFNRDRDKRIKVRPAKFFTQFQMDRHATPLVSSIECMAKEFAEAWAKVVSLVMDQHLAYEVTVFRSPDDIAREYMNFEGTSLQSCMSHQPEDFKTGGVHPCECYGGDSRIHLAVIYQKDTGDKVGRTLLYEGKFIRIYPCNNTDHKHLMENVLALQGFAADSGTLENARLNYIPHGGGETDVVVCPYLDGMHSCVRPIYSEKGTIRHLLVTSGNDTFDTQSGELHRVGAFNVDTLDVFESSTNFEYFCSQCESDFDENDNTVWTVENTAYCCDDCAVDAGYEFAYTGEVDHREWTQESCWEFDGCMYTDEALSEHGLCVTENGEVYKKEQCSDTNKGWYANDDLIFVSTYQQYKDCLSSPRCRDGVWYNSDTNTTTFIHSRRAEDELELKLQFLSHVYPDGWDILTDP